MKGTFIFTICVWLIGVVLWGLSQPDEPADKLTNKIPQVYNVRKLCMEGVVYLQTTSATLSVLYNTDKKIVPCDELPNIPRKD